MFAFQCSVIYASNILILLTKTTAAQNEVALSNQGIRGLCFLAVVFASTIVFYVSIVSNIHITYHQIDCCNNKIICRNCAHIRHVYVTARHSL